MSQVIKKRDIIIASVLKPVDDTRMFEKMARSLAREGAFRVHLFGYPSRATPVHPDIRFYPSSAFDRISLRRSTTAVRIFFRMLSIRPVAVVVNTHELLAAGVLLKWLTGCTLTYDVRENYYRNIRYLPTFPRWLRPPLALYVRLKERALACFFDHFILAEAAYRDELPFTRRKGIVLENKISRAAIGKRVGQRPRTRLLFSGTLAESSGVFNAIALAIALQRVNAAITLHVIGYCAQPATRRKIRAAVEGSPFITITGLDQLVPHEEITKAIADAGFGIVAYPSNPATDTTTPTKLFEYLASHLPILLKPHPRWMALCDAYSAAIPFDPTGVNADQLWAAMASTTFYTHAPGDEVTWESQVPTFLGLFRKNAP